MSAEVRAQWEQFTGFWPRARQDGPRLGDLATTDGDSQTALHVATQLNLAALALWLVDSMTPKLLPICTAFVFGKILAPRPRILTPDPEISKNSSSTNLGSFELRLNLYVRNLR